MTTHRFQPVRAGIVGLWDYTETNFAFADGRLVLRGANGSGKTKALEVLFPFVLDGRLDPRRLDPFSGENRTMKENLLWRGTDAGHGYAWIEFAGPAGDAPGTRHVTVGVGLRAQRHRPTPGAWFFVAEGRVGEDFDLVVDHRPVTRRELTDVLGDVVVERSSEHRRRVDETLFGLGPERYEAMLDLVLTLRRPMLAKDLDPRRLSETLSRGLRPLDDDLLEQVARSFDDLEAVQRDLDQLAAADEAAREFLTAYRGYLRTQARHRADGAIEAAAAHATAGEREDAAHRALDEARAAEAMAEAETAEAEQRLAADRARRDALRASEAYTTAGQLEHLEQAVRDRADEVTRAERRRDAAAEEAQRAEVTRAEEERRHARATAEVERVRPRLEAAAPEAGVDFGTADAHGTADEVRRRLGARTAARRADLQAVRTLVDAVEDAERRALEAERSVGRAEEADAAADRELRAAETAVSDVRRQLADALRAWADAHAEVVDADDLTAVLDVVPTAGGDDGRLPAEVWRERLAGRRDEATSERARLDRTREDLAEQRATLAERRQAILDERDDAPPPVAWRGAGRERRAGAPLWRLVRFADEVTPTAAAGIEAALEATGLLDAWVTPDGGLADEAHDAFLLVPGAAAPDADRPVPPVPGQSGAVGPPTLAEVLVPEEQDEVPAAVVARLLATIPRGPDAGADAPADVTVGEDGRYRLGPLAGHHRLDAPRYLGATARANHRAARATALQAEIDELDREDARVTARLAELTGWLGAADAATAALPGTAALQGRLREAQLAAGRRHQARTALDVARADEQAVRRELTDRRSELRREAGARGLPADAAGVASVAEALQRFESDGAELVRTLGLADARAEALASATERAAATSTALEQADRELTSRRGEHETRAVELDTLRARMGAEVTSVLEELGEVEAAISAGDERLHELAARMRETAARRGQAEGEVRAAGEAVAVAAERRQRDEQRLAVLARPDLAGALGLSHTAELSTGQLLTAVDELTTGVSASDERRKAAQTRITRGLEDLERALGSGYRPAWDVEDDVIVVTVSDDTGVRPLAAFADQLAAQRAEQEALLTSRERALFEDTLLTSVCGQIHVRIQTTRDLVATMDEQMRSRRLSSQQTVGVAWRALDTATPEWKHVHRLLDQDPAHFGPDQLDELRRHFSAEIKAARAADPQAPYRELLADVLDYRTWRRFELFLVEADGSESLLTRARHARLSGGEKAASLHLPLFAAAHAAFAGARDDCPRLLGLDEAFAGIDDQGRSELLSLSVTFDLDLFMTGYDLWAVDPAVPAVAHYDLLHLPDAHAVSSLLVLWNGRELVEGPDAEAAVAGAADG
jgi:uncharacterized protein (TIGR02680 family)